MPTYGLTEDGFNRKPLDAIKAEIEAEQKATISTALNTSAASVVGQLNAPIAAKLAELWELAQAVDAAFDPDKAEGAQQDSLYSLTNTLRRGATRSRVTAQVELEDGASIGIGEAIASVEGNPSARFVNVEPMINDSGDTDTFEVLFEAEETGPVVANAGTLTVIEETATGWVSIDNNDDATLGENIESHAAYRLRRSAELAAQGGGTVAGIRADVAQLVDAAGNAVVRSVEVLENDDSVEDENGLPPHSFEVLVDVDLEANPEAAQLIAESIWSNKPAGIKPHGSTEVTIEDSEGVEHVVRFTFVETVPVYVHVDFTLITGDHAGSTSDGAGDVIAAAVRDVNDPAFLGVNTDVYAGALYCALLDAGFHAGIRVRVSFSDPAGLADAEFLEIGIRQRAQIDSDHISTGPV